MKKKKALITGITGQDGAYLSQLLLDKNIEVYGVVRRSSQDSLERINYLKLNKKIKFIYCDLTEYQKITKIIQEIKPDFFFNLAAQSFVSFSYDNPVYTDTVNNLAVINILESIKNFSNKTRFYQASSSEMFGNSRKILNYKFLNEDSKFDPISPYAIAKLSAYYYTKMYRESYGVFSSNGILFNHESPFRGENFVTKKIIKGLVNFKFKKKEIIELGNIYSKRDWGDAREYVKYIYKILTLKKPDDFLLSTNKQYSVKDFINLAAPKINLKLYWRGAGMKEKAFDENGKVVIKVSKKFFRPNDVVNLIGKSIKSKKLLGWKEHNHNINKLIDDMIKYEKEKIGI